MSCFTEKKELSTLENCIQNLDFIKLNETQVFLSISRCFFGNRLIFFQVMFRQNFNVGKISTVPLGQGKNLPGLTEVQCLPFYSILLAMNNVPVDYFSLDVEGHELEVLKTIPWDKVNITVSNEIHSLTIHLFSFNIQP